MHDQSGSTASPAPAACDPVSPGCWLNHGQWPAEPQRTIVMTGAARTGTSFISSSFGNLGLAMCRDPRDTVSAHGEHLALRQALTDGQHDALRTIVGEFDARFDIWGWKAPAIRNHFDVVGQTLRNPCYVVVFKEPLSVAMRKAERGAHADLARQFNRIFKGYQALATFAAATPRPCLMVSYDRAVSHMEETLATFARFGGIAEYDLSAVVAGIRDDARNYAQAK